MVLGLNLLLSSQYCNCNLRVPFTPKSQKTAAIPPKIPSRNPFSQSPFERSLRKVPLRKVPSVAARMPRAAPARATAPRERPWVDDARACCPSDLTRPLWGRRIARQTATPLPTAKIFVIYINTLKKHQFCRIP